MRLLNNHKTVFIFVAVMAFMILFPPQTRAEYYKVYIEESIDDDLFLTNSGLYIETYACFRDSWGESAILKYDDYGYDNKLIFNDGTSCRVERIFQ